MNFTCLDVEGIYRRMLAETDPAVHERLFLDEVVAPYEPVFRMFGGIAAASQWGMFTAEALNNGSREKLVDMLERLAAVDAWHEAVKTLEDARRSFALHLDKIPLENIVFGLLPIQAGIGSSDDHAYAGFGGMPGWIMVTVSPLTGAVSLPRLKGATAHELLHNLHFSVYPFQPMQTSVGGYIIAEGLAESFAAELYGESATGPWVNASSEADLMTGKQLIGAALNVTGFNEIRRYIFGDNIVPGADSGAERVPDYAGYAIGYRVVQAYLKRTGKTVPQTIFVPADEIIAESGYFD